jgi:hypothetical protein
MSFVSTKRARVWLAVIVGAALALLTGASPVGACSICRCGDPTFNALGKDGYAARGFRLALDWERYDKQEGPSDGEAEELIENRVTALVSYGFSERFTLYARVPFSHRRFQELDEGAVANAFNTNGLADPEIYGQVRLWASGLAAGLGRRSSLSLLGGVKTALGDNNATIDGERADEHAQPGTGSTDVFGGVAFLYLFDKHSAFFSSGQYRHTGENDLGYRYGRSVLFNAAYERKLSGRIDGVLELNFRHAQKDRANPTGELGENTGGSVLYVTPRLLFDAGHGVVLRAAAQIPIARDLNGAQKERAVFNAGVSFLFGGH